MRIRSGRAIAVVAMLAAAGVIALFLLQAGRIREEWYLRRLLSEHEARREEAASKLAELGVVRAMPRLIDMLRGQTGMSLKLREPAWLVRALEDVVRPEAIPFLEEASRDADLEVRSWALGGLSRIRHGGLDALIRLVADGEPALRVEAIDEIRRLGPDAAAALRPLEAALRDPDPGVRLAAAGALAQLGPGAAPVVLSLVAALRDPDPGVLRQAVAALRKVGTAAAVGPLVEAFKRDASSRAVVVMALADQCGAGPEGDALRRLLEGHEPEVVEAVVEIEERMRKRREREERERREKEESRKQAAER